MVETNNRKRKKTMPKYEIEFKHLVERTVTCIVEANDEEEALTKAKDGDFEETDEDLCPEQGIETTDYVILGEIVD